MWLSSIQSTGWLINCLILQQFEGLNWFKTSNYAYSSLNVCMNKFPMLYFLIIQGVYKSLTSQMLISKLEKKNFINADQVLLILFYIVNINASRVSIIPKSQPRNSQKLHLVFYWPVSGNLFFAKWELFAPNLWKIPTVKNVNKIAHVLLPQIWTRNKTGAKYEINCF